MSLRSSKTRTYRLTEELRVAAALHGLYQHAGECVHLGLLVLRGGGVMGVPRRAVAVHGPVAPTAGRHLAGGTWTDGLVQTLVSGTLQKRQWSGKQLWQPSFP